MNFELKELPKPQEIKAFLDNYVIGQDEAKRVLADEYPQLEGKLLPALPDEKSRRVGQSVAAASLPEL